MPAGRPAKPTADHKRDGTYQKCRHEDRADEKMAIGEPIKPDFEDDRASKAWDLIVSGLHPDVKAQVDTLLLIGACRWWCKWLDYIEQLDNEEDVNECYKIAGMAAMAWKNFAAVASRFGMSPADRARLKMASEKREPDDPLAQMLRERAGRN